MVRVKNENMLHVGVYVGSRGVSRIGDFMLLVAINLWVLNKTHSPEAVSVLWIIPAVAQLVVTPWAGSITDRRDKRRVMIVVELIRAVLIAGMAMSSNLWLLYMALFLVNGVGSFFASASSPYVNYLVPNYRRKRVNAVLGTLQSGALIVGPALTGLILRMSGSISLAIWLDAVSFFVSALCMATLPKLAGQRALESAAPEEKRAVNLWWNDIKIAFGVLRQRALFSFLFVVVTMSGVLGGATDSQEAVFARVALHLSSSAYSLLIAIAGVGYIVGALFVTIFANKMPLRLLIGTGSVIASCGFVIYAWSHSFFTASIGFIVLGMFQSLASAGFSTFYQFSLPSEYMGRVSNVTSPLTQILIVVFTILVGIIVNAIGVRDTTIGSTTLMFLFGLVTLITVFSTRAKGTFHSVEEQLSVG